MPENTDVQEIVEEWLRTGGYDGLFDEDECSCTVDDLMPCSGPNIALCKPGYKGPCDCGDHDFHIYATKDAAELAQKEIDELKREDGNGDQAIQVADQEHDRLAGDRGQEGQSCDQEKKIGE